MLVKYIGLVIVFRQVPSDKEYNTVATSTKTFARLICSTNIATLYTNGRAGGEGGIWANHHSVQTSPGPPLRWNVSYGYIFHRTRQKKWYNSGVQVNCVRAFGKGQKFCLFTQVCKLVPGKLGVKSFVSSLPRLRHRWREARSEHFEGNLLLVNLHYWVYN